MILIDDLETFLGIADGTDTALLIAIEEEAVAWFEKQTGRFFGAEEAVTEIVLGGGESDLYLTEEPGGTVSVIEQAYFGATQETITAANDDGWEVRDQHLARKGGYVWQLGYEYLVTYTRGYTEDAAAVADVSPADIDAPADVQRAIKGIISFWYNGGDPASGTSQKTSETMGNYSYTRGAMFSNAEAMLNAVPGLRETLGNWEDVRI